MIKALIIVDVQNDYFKGGSMELINMDTAANNCRQLLEKFREYDFPIFQRGRNIFCSRYERVRNP